MHARRRAALSLIELLVVLTLLAILWAILLPVFSSAREAGRSASCMSSGRQLAVAFLLYLESFDQVYPESGNATRNPDWSWVRCPGQYQIDVRGGALYGLVGCSPNIYVCPSDDLGRHTGLTYAMNERLARLPAVEVMNPAGTVLLLDEASSSVRNDAAFDWRKERDLLSDAHNGFGTLLFADGHAKAHLARTLVGEERRRLFEP